MIISFKNINGGGGGGYVLPTATPTRLGGVKIGEGINVDSAGTISVTGGTVEEMPISPFMSKNLNGNGRCYSKEVDFTFGIALDNSGQTYNNYTFNPYLSIKQLNGRNWNQSSYLDIYITKGEQDEYPTFKLVNGYNIGQGFVSEKLIEETLDFNIGIEGEYNQVEFDIRDFLLRGDSRYGSQEYTVKGLKVEIISEENGSVHLKLKMDSNDNQTFLNYLMLPNDAYDYNVNITQTFATTQGHYPIATNSNVGMVQIGTGFTYSNNNGALSVPTASKNQTGIVRIGDGLDIDENGVLSDKDDVKVVSELPTTSVTETIGSIWYDGQEQTGDFTYRTGNDIGFRKGNTNPQENITLFKIESYQNYTTLEITPDGTYIVTDESGTEHYLNFEGDFLEISGTMVTYTFSYNYEGANETLTITLSEDKEIEDVYVDTPVTKVLAVGDEGDVVAMVDASENLCFYEIVNQEWSEKYAHNTGGGGGIEVVTELPASGTDGQVIVLEQDVPAFIVNYDPDTSAETTHIEVTGIGFTEATQIFDLEFFGEHVKVYINEDGETLVYNTSDVLEATLGEGDMYTHEYSYVPEFGPQYASFTCTSTGFIMESNPNYGLAKEYAYPKTIKPASKKCISYIWDTTSPTCDIYQKFGEEGNSHKNNTIVTYFGELPQNEVIFEQYHPYWNQTWYWAFDGEMIRAYSDTGMTNEINEFNKPTLNSVKAGARNITFTDGLLVYNDYELSWNLNVYGNWADAGNGHWKPLDYEAIKTNALQLVDKTNSTRLYMPGVSDIFVEGGNGGIIYMCLPDGFGNAGQMLMSQGNERPGKWVEFKPIKVLDTLPVYANEGDIVIVSPFSETDNSSFVSRNSTSEPNNFNFDEELGHTGEGHYLCFVNDGYDYTNVPNKTLIAVIQMRTDESWEWNNDHIEEAYLYFNSEDDGTGNWVQYYSLEYDFMKTIGGEPVQFSGQYTVDDTNTTVDSDWLNIWNDNYGYKFNLEYVEGAAQNYLYFRLVHSSGEGEDSGDVWVRIHYYTKQFKSGVSENCEPSEFYIFKNGIWIKLGKTEEPQV